MSPGASNPSPTKRALGAYYTPLPAAQALTRWAIRSRSDRILDPSFGGCAFFAASIDRLAELGSRDPFGQLSGVDIDPGAKSFLRKLPGYRARPGTFKIETDFLNVDPRRDSRWAVDVIVGNPPYIRHHALTASQVAIGQRSAASHGFTLSKSASYWSYFVLHSLAFVREGGRLAMVLPVSLLNADYAQSVVAALRQCFARTRLVALEERLFADAQEASVLVLAEGARQAGGRVELSKVRTIDEIHGLIAADRLPQGTAIGDDCNDWRSQFLSATDRALYSCLSDRDDVVPLSEFAKVSVGLVTGCNSFFVLQPSEADALGIAERHLARVVCSATQLRGLCFSREDEQRSRLHNDPCFLLVVAKGRQPRAVQDYLASESGREARRRYKCSLRDPWYRLTDTNAPDAFLTCVNGQQPRIVRNDARSVCTNALHRLWWRQGLEPTDARLVVLSFLSSLSGLSAEIVGRSYGGGALKLEPGDARRVIVARPQLASAKIAGGFSEASRLVKQRLDARASDVADEVVLRDGLGLASSDVARLREARESLRALREPKHFSSGLRDGP